MFVWMGEDTVASEDAGQKWARGARPKPRLMLVWIRWVSRESGRDETEIAAFRVLG